MCLRLLWRENGAYVQSVKIDTTFFGIQDIRQLVDAKLFQDSGKLLLEYLAHAKFDCVFKGKVLCTDDVCLSNAINAADPLLQLHRVPGQVVVEDDVAELEVQTFPAGVGGD